MTLVMPGSDARNGIVMGEKYNNYENMWVGGCIKCGELEVTRKHIYNERQAVR